MASPSAPTAPPVASGAPAAPLSARLAPQSPRYSRRYISAVVGGYFAMSISMVFLNKLLMDPASTLPAPFAISAAQAALTAGICVALGSLGRGARAGSWLSQFPVVTYDAAVARAVLPLSLVFCGMIAFNNLCLAYVEVSFYQVARSLTIGFNVLFTWLLLGERTRLRTLGCLAVVVAGFAVSSGGEVRFSALGTFFGVISSAFVSLNSIYTKTVLRGAVGGNQWALAAYNTINAAAIFGALSLVLGEPAAAAASPALASPRFWGLLLASGAAGFGIGILTIMQIEVTSPLTHNISGTAKSAVQTALALLIWRNPTTPLNLAGTGLVLAGSFAYALERHRELGAAEAEAEESKERETPPSGAGAPGGEPARVIKLARQVVHPAVPAIRGIGGGGGGGGGGGDSSGEEAERDDRPSPREGASLLHPSGGGGRLSARGAARGAEGWATAGSGAPAAPAARRNAP